MSMKKRMQRKRILNRDNKLCGIHMGGCGQPIKKGEEYNTDHIVPKAFFSTVAKSRIAEFNKDWNCQPMHVCCNNDVKSFRLSGWPQFSCKCHYLQIYDSDLYICTKDNIGKDRHKFLANVVSNRNDKVDAQIIVGSSSGKGGKNIAGYWEDRFGYLLPGIAQSRVELFNLTERARVGLPSPKYIWVDGAGQVTPLTSLEAIDARLYSPESYNDRGLFFSKKRKYVDALENYDEAIRKKRIYPDAFRNRGVVKAKLGRNADAMDDFNIAIRQDPNFAGAYYNRGLLNSTMGRQEEAIADYDEAIRLKSNYPGAYCNRGVSKMSLGKWEQALVDFNTAVEMNPRDAKALNNRAKVFSKLGRIPKAIIDLEAAIRICPNSTEIHYNLGVMLASANNFMAARKHLETATKLAESNGNMALIEMVKSGLKWLQEHQP